MVESNIAKEIEVSLMREHGPVMTGKYLSRALGYPSLAAFRKSLSRNTVPITIFTLPNRSGKFALTKDIAEWLAIQRLGCRKEEENE